MSAVRVLSEIDTVTTAGVRALAEAAERADGREPFSEQFLLNLRGGAREGVVHLVVGTAAATDRAGSEFTGAEDVVAGYAQLDGTSAELAVHPDHRRRGIGAALLAELTARAAKLDVWAHGDLPAAAALAASRGLERARVLWQMRRTPDAGPLPALTVPEGVTIRPFVVGEDEAEFLRVNNAAFDWHPEQGGWTVDQVREREAEEWFDAEGFLLAVDANDPAGTVLGYHWTKVHPPTATEPSMGEVYVLGVDPAAHGRGLGRVLTLAGLHHLAGRGLDTVLLYVEADNAPAVRVYEKLGFAVHTSDVMYSS
ncbi:mycothiol synthase [Pseudonocardia kujensis]|uniref:mycothiol synthase n=1 Tax=Pseudonocardia kujensis TaxID=1128675 RepID=UPI001E401872|nr:mycothiol synthase [Pseudonocardia kujensis]MCE0765831.1 mycothiol synthase [Pseudonocardia kujensis]